MSDGLNKVDETIIKIIIVVKFAKSCNLGLYISLKKCMEKLKVESKNWACLDTSTRWNFTYLMLNITAESKKVFDTLLSVNIKTLTIK